VSKILQFTVPLVPPSTNHYKNKNRKTGRWYINPVWTAFKEAVCLFARGRRIVAKKYEVDLTIYLGFRKRGDGDNFVKAVFDGLQAAGVVHSDAAIKKHSVTVLRDPDNPRTEITVRELAA
jgi:Holliday junction resolvase RusA-like endonuclease